MVNQPSEIIYAGGEIDARIQMAVDAEKKRITNQLREWRNKGEHLVSLEAIIALEKEVIKRCRRCGAPRIDDIDSDICGSCADELRSETGGEG